ncbi:MAG: hypothetical protein K9W43_14265 [Candidatus Thorarchaeota archaeon]|nr:hypothetical protein [Candidatus Thorarchaeota archaeon]
MLVYWGDAWVGATKGWFNVYFYPQDSSSGAQSSGYLYSSFKRTGKLWWGPFQGGDGAIYASIDGQGDPQPITECDNASRVIKYVAILGYRYSSYGLVGMRIHDINVVADLNRHDPTAPGQGEAVESDGTAGGIITNSKKTKLECNTQNVAAAYVLGNWTGPWPVYHLYILSSVSLTLIHITIDILFTIQVVRIGIIEWFFDLFGIPIDNYEYYIGLLDKIIDTILFGVMTTTLELMIAAMMIFDYTKAPAALLFGTALWLITAGIAHSLAFFYATELSNPVMAGWIWLYLLTLSLGNIIGGLFLSGYISSGRRVAKHIASAIVKLGGRIPWNGSRIKFAWASLVSLALLVGLSVFWITVYRSY